MSRDCVLILGGGINGAAIAREFLLNGLSVWLVDSADLASGATAYSSRLVHGGLRYLEYAELSLVRESLNERTRLLKLAADYVQPLRLVIPLETRFTGWWHALRRVCGSDPSSADRRQRGMWVVGTGLWLYDQIAGDSGLPKRRLHFAKDVSIPDVPPNYRWLYSFYDAQMTFPERFVVALLADAERLANQAGLTLRVLPYHQARLHHDVVQLEPLRNRAAGGETLRPKAIVNATGSWVDATLISLGISETRLMGGTKGSHIITFHPGLKQWLQGCGMYVEASDGRPVFILPWHTGTLIGTTDVPYEGPPEQARASEAERTYLLDAVNQVFAAGQLDHEDVALHYAGVRPLPYADSSSPAAITRRHGLRAHTTGPVPLFSVIGGKLTTCRSLAEQVVRAVCTTLGKPPYADSREREISATTDAEPGELESQQRDLARRVGLSRDQVRAAWHLCGNTTPTRLLAGPEPPTEATHDTGNIAELALPRRLARNVIRQEWACCLNDLVERRLMLLYEPTLSARSLMELATLLAEEGRISHDEVVDEARATCRRLETHFGRQIQHLDAIQDAIR
jgi:glycerol-3-phosphate dehydrogenase